VTASHASEPHGLLVVDKCPGPTSHDAVAVVRRVLGTRTVGHTGTLDPMASGVLVVVVGEATKLVNLLTSGEKAYDASIRLGTSTHTLDAEGEITGSAPVPALSLERVREACSRFLGEIEQRPPAVSAIKVDGKSLHKRVRAGEAVEAPLRRVCLSELTLHALEGDTLKLSLRCSKGFYVRALARDLAEALGTLGHLSALRRTHNAGFGLAQSVSFDALRAAARAGEAERAAIREQLTTLREACQRLPHRSVDEAAARALAHGRGLNIEPSGPFAELDEGQPWIALDPSAAPVAIVERSGSALRVLRGFRPV
jgi:tRNA pseudouridine55 synthase